MRVPIRPYDVKLTTRWPKCVVLHDTKEIFGGNGLYFHDTPAVQFNKLTFANFRETKMTSLPYHFLIENVQNEYNIFACQPLFTYCEHNDISNFHKAGLHVAILGDLNMEIPPTRLYNVLAFRLLAPMVRLFRISLDNIVTHREISYDKDVCKCPGEFFDKTRLIGHLRRYLRRRSISIG